MNISFTYQGHTGTLQVFGGFLFVTWRQINCHYICLSGGLKAAVDAALRDIRKEAQP